MHWLMQSGELYRMWRCITEVKGRWRDISGFLVAQMVKKSACNVGDLGLIPGLGRSLEEVMATHSSVLDWRIPMDRGAWQGTVHGVPKSWTWLRDWAPHTEEISDRGKIMRSSNLCVNILNKQWQLGKQSVSEERLLVDPWVGFMPNRYWNRWK